MTSQSLYRKYRPQRFAEVVGQDHITTALRNAVREDRVGHAYLFSGPRGTGKTTTARILAKALNCLDLSDDGEPCGKCENCLAVASGTFFDLAELDAASNNGVENVRDLIQSVNLGLGATAKRKVYLIDEVHMLSSAASNALLKTLEEPPAHVVFILATTDPQKVLPTIRSRTQHFDFHLFSVEELSGLLEGVLAQEGIDATAEVLGVIARRGAGSARDSLSLLDQALALGSGTIDGAQVQATFGGTPFDERLAVLDAAAADDPGGALVAVQRILNAGIEPRRLADDLLATLRDAFVQLASGGKVPYEGPHEEEPKLAALADALGAAGLTRAIDLFGAAIVDIRSPTAPDPRLVLEVAVVRCARRDARTPVDALLDRVSRLEARLDHLGSGPAPGQVLASAAPRAAAAAADAADAGPLSSNLRRRRAAGPDTAAATPTVGDTPAEPVANPVPAEPVGTAAPGEPVATDAPVEPAGFELDDVIMAWNHALGALSAPVRAAVAEAHPIAVEGVTVVFGVPRIRAEAINKRFRAEADAIKAGLAAHLGAVPSLLLRPHDFEVPGALRPAGTDRAPAAEASGAPEPAVDDLPDVVDLAELVDAPAEHAPLDSATRLLDAFGGEIVEERRRDPS